MKMGKLSGKMLFGVLTVAFTFVITMSYYHLWGTDINVPISAYRGDSLGVLLEANNYARGGNVHKYVCLGAPNIGGFWWNIGDSSVIIPFIRILWLISGSLEAAVNIHAILNHVLIALCMYLVCTKLGIKSLHSMVAGISYSSLTLFVFFANTHLLIYNTCYYIPAFCYIIIFLMKKEENFTLKKVILIIAVMLYTGLNSAYYAFFAMIILAFAGVYALFYLKSVDKILGVGLSFICIGMGIAIYTMPNILHSSFRLDTLWNLGLYYPVCAVIILVLAGIGWVFYIKVYPKITIKTIWIFCAAMGVLLCGAYIFIARYTGYLGTYGERSVYQVQEMTLSIVNLIMPAVNTIYYNINEQMGLLVDLKNCDFSVLGVLSGFGFLASVLYVFQFKNEINQKNEILQICGKCSCFIMLIAMKGGVSLLIALYITTGIRYYSRICIFVACFSLIAFAVILDKIVEWGEKINYIISKAVIYGMVIIGLTLSIPIDFIYKNTYGNQYGFAEYNQREKEYYDWKELMEQIEADVPQGSMVLEFTYLPDMNYYYEDLMIHGRQYELAVPAVLSKTTSWSYPRMVDVQINRNNIEEILQNAAAYNFRGIYIDRLLYDDSVLDEALILLEEYLGSPIICNEDRRYFFNMEKYTSEVQARHSEQELEGIREGAQYIK